MDGDVRLGDLRTLVTLDNPTRTADTEGGYTETWAALDPSQAFVAIRRLSGRERNNANTVLATATHEVKMRYHSGVTTQTRLSWTDRAERARALSVIEVDDVEERGAELRLTCAEVGLA